MHHYSRLLLALLASLLLACGGKEATWTINPSWTPTERAIILRAIDSWCTATDGQACLVVAEDGDSTIRLREPWPDHPGRAGWAYHERRTFAGIIEIVDRRNDPSWLDNMLYQVAIHEVGHALGCDGDWRDGEPNTMAATEGEQIPVPTARDLACVTGNWQ